ncbi:putative bifunctional diguanylate cyclase/phosphodiesterase [Pannonibacter sp. SL95]|uniref:putative bifunctional diguanylate cyclase/phosphodiesterase n=1 Tax=Pannonibacter sp. SL95 TaxID=2995153 RepID=UPI00227280BC|nr:EAL domain-containing protein [Pannonibacter sp. SL95]MCY1704691.1 EAL domain-containing protein [Pannonibacter sp. SL95]
MKATTETEAHAPPPARVLDLKPAKLGNYSFAALLVGMFAAIVAAFIFVLSAILIYERESAVREISSVERAYENHKLRLLEQIERYAASNAAYVNTDTAFDPEWVRSRFGRALAVREGYDLVVILDRDLNEAFSYLPETAPTELGLASILSPQVARLITDIRQRYVAGLVTGRNGDTYFSGTMNDVSAVTEVQIGQRIAIVAAMAIFPDPGGIPMRRDVPLVLLAVKQIDAQALSDMLASLSLTNLFLDRKIPAGMNGTAIVDEDGAPLAYLTWDPMARASQIILASAPVLAIALFIILAIALLVLRRNTAAYRELEVRKRDVLEAARHDGLTGLLRRDFFLAAADELLDQPAASTGTLGVLYVDIDGLTQINDAFGHVVGDHLIQHVVSVMQRKCRRTDIIGRMGGDEIVLILSGRASADVLVEDVRTLATALNKTAILDDHAIEVSCSIGVAIRPDHGTRMPSLLRAADVALQRCRAGGRRQFKLFDCAMDEEIRERRRLRDGMRQALERNEFDLFYQPIVDARDGKVRHLEALLRWHHPERGLLAPGAFLDVAEETGLIDPIGAWVLQRAIRDASTWDGAGVSVNVCATQVGSGTLPQQIEALLAETGLPPSRLTLEVTETVMMERSEVINATITRLSSLGIGIAIDDFGTGYSSLSYLHQYRFQTLKIDRSFVARLGTDPKAQAIIRSLVELARTLDMTVVAEGVETEEQKVMLASAGCQMLQGYLFSRPKPVLELADQGFIQLMPKQGAMPEVSTGSSGALAG